jgi:NADPH:quinone reductase-like Zn-dependent oxidoreductase
LDIARAAEQTLSAQDIGRRARDQALVALAEHGTLQPVIDSVSPFMQIVDAHRRVDSGRKVGSVVLRFDHDH